MTKVKTIDEYVKSFPDDVRHILQKIRSIIAHEMPTAEQTISYGIPTFKIDGKYVIYFAGWKKHVSVYPIPTGDRAFQKEIAPYVAGRGTLKFSLDKPIPYELISKVAKHSLLLDR